MRDPNRIDNFCNLLKEYWSKVPDWRFGQLISNILGDGPFLFYIEDNESLEKMEKFFHK